MSDCHILRDGFDVRTPKWATHERADMQASEKVWTNCCTCKVRADETVASIRYKSHPPTGDQWLPDASWEGEHERLWWASYFDPDWIVTCADGFGCTVNPRKKCGQELRSYWRFE